MGWSKVSLRNILVMVEDLKMISEHNLSGDMRVPFVLTASTSQNPEIYTCVETMNYGFLRFKFFAIHVGPFVHQSQFGPKKLWSVSQLSALLLRAHQTGTHRALRLPASSSRKTKPDEHRHAQIYKRKSWNLLLRVNTIHSFSAFQ